jgi:hypothetical protein
MHWAGWTKSSYSALASPQSIDEFCHVKVLPVGRRCPADEHAPAPAIAAGWRAALPTISAAKDVVDAGTRVE